MTESVRALGRLEERLERGEVIAYPVSPFRIPEGSDRDFLLQQRLASRAHKNIGFNPMTGRARGFAYRSATQAERLRQILSLFAESVTDWLKTELPAYAANWQRDLVSFRPEQEATRKLRISARNDLMHVDAFPNRPTQGARILRVFVNINRTEPRYWITGDPFGPLLQQYGEHAGLPTEHADSLPQRLGRTILGWFNRKRRDRTAYDQFMLRFHHFLKREADFQQNGVRQRWEFQPGSAWMCFTDTASHSVLSGRAALEHTYFVAPESLVLPDESPAALLAQACRYPVLQRAA